MKVHSFKESMARSFEDEIDVILNKHNFILQEVEREEQRKGIDRIASFLKKPSPHTLGCLSALSLYKLEYKADLRVYDTGNFFIETISVDKGDSNIKLGWIHYSEADYIVYYMEKDKHLSFVPLNKLKELVNVKKYKERKCFNKGYNSQGYLVPRKDVEELVSFNLHF